MIKNYIGIRINYPLFLSDLMKLEFSRHIFTKSSNIKFHENLSSGNRDVSCGRTDTMKPIVAFLNFANPPPKTSLEFSIEVFPTKTEVL